MQDAEVEEHGSKDAPVLSRLHQLIHLGKLNEPWGSSIIQNILTEKGEYQVDDYVDSDNDIGNEARILAQHEAGANHLALHTVRARPGRDRFTLGWAGALLGSLSKAVLRCRLTS